MVCVEVEQQASQAREDGQEHTGFQGGHILAGIVVWVLNAIPHLKLGHGPARVAVSWQGRNSENKTGRTTSSLTKPLGADLICRRIRVRIGVAVTATAVHVDIVTVAVCWAVAEIVVDTVGIL